MTYSAESYLDVINYNIRKHILNQNVKLEDDRNADNLLENQFLHSEELTRSNYKIIKYRTTSRIIIKT